ncbi:MAG: YIP1 family protein [Burkholderiaceae bacterium]|nr:YIP1 family protein [Pseudomonadota bacterium]MBS0596329.1 YIP1 family protein [Pseudomonadota bacterium]MCO5117763.1 YIP1 family protein [Burkholderiaceae bacterium]MCP5217795.1 YIP1 family protein [Burkholderiaceae bacterium]
MSLVDRVKGILLDPRRTWPVIEAESTSTAELYRGYLVWLAAIPAVCGFIGLSLIGIGGFGFTVRVPLLMGLGNLVVSYVLSLVGVFVLALIVDALAPTFGGTRSSIQALKLTVYASTAALVGGVFSLLPMLSILGLLAALYSVYLIYTGLPVLMKNPPEKSLAYTAVVIVAGIVMGLVIGAISALFRPHHGMVGAGGAGVSITTPQGKVSIDTAALEAAGKKMQEATRQMEQAQQGGKPADAAAAAGQAAAAAMGALGGAQGSVGVPALKAALPDQLGGLPRTALEVQNNQAMGVAMGQARAEYGSAGKRLRVEIIDMGGLSGLAQMAGLVQGEKESDGRIEKTWQSGGRTLMEEYHKDGSQAEAKTILKNGLVVSVEGTGVPIDGVRAALGQLDLAALEGLARTAQQK